MAKERTPTTANCEALEKVISRLRSAVTMIELDSLHGSLEVTIPFQDGRIQNTPRVKLEQTVRV